MALNVERHEDGPGNEPPWVCKNSIASNFFALDFAFVWPFLLTAVLTVAGHTVQFMAIH